MSACHVVLCKNFLVQVAPELQQMLLVCDPEGLLAQRVTPTLLDLASKTRGAFDNGNSILEALVLVVVGQWLV